jgi:hypothetical protein
MNRPSQRAGRPGKRGLPPYPRSLHRSELPAPCGPAELYSCSVSRVFLTIPSAKPEGLGGDTPGATERRGGACVRRPGILPERRAACTGRRASNNPTAVSSRGGLLLPTTHFNRAYLSGRWRPKPPASVLLRPTAGCHAGRRKARDGGRIRFVVSCCFTLAKRIYVS